VTPDEQKKWLEWVLITSIPLKRLAPDGLPIGVASGCLVNYRNRKFILTVSHAVELGLSDWVIQLGDDEIGTEIYRPFSFIYPHEIRRSTGEILNVDFTFAEVAVDIAPVFQHLTPRGPMSERIFRHIFDLTAIGDPELNELYAFSGEINPEVHGTYALVTQPTVYPGLRYVGTDGLSHQFQLPVPHPGHSYFKGCSGAPIVDSRGRLAALVTGGDEERSVIHGMTLSRLKSTLDFYCDGIRPVQGR
jgi:hypothetical protein